MKITITRYRKKAETIDGRLTITTGTKHRVRESIRICDTAENALSALPAGTYRVTFVKCKHYRRKMPVICSTESSRSSNVSTAPTPQNPSLSPSLSQNTIHYTLNTTHSALHTTPSTLHAIRYTLNTKPSALHTTQKNCTTCHRLSFVCNNTVLPCYCPMLKPGNGVYHRTDGSIIVGQYIAPGCLLHPRRAFAALYDRMRKSHERGHELTLEIVEDYPSEPHPLTNYELGTLALKHF